MPNFGFPVQGNLVSENNGSPFQLGAPPACAGNTISGGVTVQSDSGSTSISGNTVSGGVTVQSDTGSTQVLNNNIQGLLKCSGNATITGSGNHAEQKQGQCAGF